MTEHQDSSGRVDLRALAPDQAEQERLVEAIMGRLAGRAQLPPERPEAVLEAVAFLPSRWVATAAAAIFLLSVAVVLLTRNPPPSPEEVIAAWADRQHVPTNGELLTAFLGYTP